MKNERLWPENGRVFRETNGGDASAIFQDRSHALFPASGSSQPPPVMTRHLPRRLERTMNPEKTMAKPRINIPTGASDLIGLAAAIQEKHTELGKDSPLALLDWKTVATQVKEAGDAQDKIDKLSKQLEKLTEQRNNLVGPLGDFVRSARDVLSGVYRAEMRTLGDFGFEVDDTPRTKKPKPGSPAP